jgi:hypothetical protein
VSAKVAAVLLRYAQRNLLSAVPLPSLPASVEPLAAVTIRVDAPTILPRLEAHGAWLHEWREADGSISLQLAKTATDYLFRVPGLCDFRIDPGTGAVGMEHADGIDAETLEHLLIDQALPRLLAAQGELVGHASCIFINGRGVLLLGQSGWGKSTLAGLLHRRGHLPMSDDCVVLERTDDAVLATPTYPSLRLYDDSIREAFERAPQASPVASYTRKRRVRLDATTRSRPLRLNAMYLLNHPAQAPERSTITPLSPAMACMALIQHSFRLDITSAEQSTEQLQRAAAVARRIPAYSLAYRRDFSEADALVDQLVGHCAGA